MHRRTNWIKGNEEKVWSFELYSLSICFTVNFGAMSYLSFSIAGFVLEVLERVLQHLRVEAGEGLIQA